MGLVFRVRVRFRFGLRFTFQKDYVNNSGHHILDFCTNSNNSAAD